MSRKRYRPEEIIALSQRDPSRPMATYGGRQSEAGVHLDGGRHTPCIPPPGART